MNAIQANMRNVKVKAKQLRHSGFVPCVIFGASLEESIPVQISSAEAKQLKRIKRQGSLVNIRVEGKCYHTLIKELDYNIMKNEIIHISFQLLEDGKKVNSVADIILLNKDKVQGVLEQIQMKIPHAAEPEYLLDTVTVDLEGCPIGTVITVGDIPEFKSDKVELQTNSDNIVLRIKEKKRAAEEPQVSSELAE